MKKHLLFICNANLNRSPTAISLFENSKEHEAKSAGISELAKTQITKRVVDWADIIFVMDEKNDKHKTLLLKKFPEAKNKPIKVLDIPDVYYRNDPELVRFLKEKLKKEGFL